MIINCSSFVSLVNVMSCFKTLAQELSGFVSSVKVKMSEELTMTTLRSVIKLCTISATTKNKVNYIFI